MKKIVKYVFVLFVLLCMTGCKKKYLTCTRVVTEDDKIKVEESVVLGYKRKLLHTSALYLDYTFKVNETQNKETLKIELEKECESYKEIKGIECLIYDIDGKLRFEIVINVEEIKEKDKEKFNDMLNYGNYTDSYRLLEKKYFCK